MYRNSTKNININKDDKRVFIDSINKSIKFGISANIIIGIEANSTPVIVLETNGGLLKINTNFNTYDWLIGSFKQDMKQNNLIEFTDPMTVIVRNAKVGFLEKEENKYYITMNTGVNNYAISVNNISNVEQFKQLLTLQ